MARATYKAKTISGAEKRVRQLLKCMERRGELLDQWCRERKLLAMLAAKGPAFSNPLHAAAAEKIRNEILASMRMNPDGSYMT